MGIEALGLGLAVGLILGLTGAGGGVLAVPALVLGLSFTLQAAAPIALIAVGASAAIGASHGLRQKQVRYRAAFVMALVGAVTAPAGIALARLVPKFELTLVFCAVMLIVAARMLRATGHRVQQEGEKAEVRKHVYCRIDPSTGRLHWNIACALTITLIGVVAGFCSGLLGVGGGFVIVPALTRLSDVKTQEVITTSLLAICLIAVSSALAAVLDGMVITAPGAIFIGGSISGMAAGRAVIGKLSQRSLMRSFAVLMIVVAVLLLIQAFRAAP